MRKIFIYSELMLPVIGLLLLFGFFAGCEKSDMSGKYYELNRQKALETITPFMYSNAESESKERFKIVHISDVHLSPWSSGTNIRNPFNLEEAIRFANDPETRIDVIVDTGDHISSTMNTTYRDAMTYLVAYAKTLFRDNNIPTFPSTGNHDSNMLNPNHPDYALSTMDLHTHLTSKINHPVFSDGKENYYYADLPNPMGGVIRVIALDVTDQTNRIYSSQHNAILSQKQIDWLCHTALKQNMTEGHSVLILVHHPMPPANEEALKGTVYNEYLHNWNMVPEIIEAFRTKESIQKAYRNKLNDTDSIAVDVSYDQSPGEFICYLGGHLHTFLHYEIKSVSQPKQLMILSNNMSPSERSANTPIQRSSTGQQNNTFNLYAIDTEKKVIYIAFFGATGFYYPQVLELAYL